MVVRRRRWAAAARAHFGGERVIVVASLIALVLAEVGTVTRFARGETPPAIVDAPRARYRQAERAMSEKNWIEAHRILIDLWQTTKTHDVAASLAVVEYQLGRYLHAARSMTFAIQNLPPKEKPEVGERYREGLAEIRSHLGTLLVSVSRPRAEVLIDGVSIGQSPLESDVHVLPGTHEFEARDERGSVKETVTIGAGESRTLRLALAARSAALSATERATAPPRSGRSLPGEDPTPPQGETQRSTIPIYVGLGFTAVGIATALGFGIVADGKAGDARAFERRLPPNGCNDASASAEECAAARDALDDQRRNAILSNVGLGIGLAAGVGTLAYVIFWPSSSGKPATGARTDLNLTMTGREVILSGSF